MHPPAEKLPLAVRKGIRDGWENIKGEYDTKLSALLGQPWTFTFNPNLIYANCDREDMFNRLGDGVKWYVEPFLRHLEKWLEVYGDDGKGEVNNICAKHTVVIHPQEETKFTYGGLEVKDGLLRIVFADKNFTTNVDSISQPDKITEAIKAAAEQGTVGATPGPLNLQSRRSIRDDWDAKVEELRMAVGKLVGVSDIKFVPNFEENAAKLKEPLKSRSDYENNRTISENLAGIGGATFYYFDAMRKYLQNQKFGEDDMLQEGFQEAVSANTIGLRLVEKLEKKHWNETVLKDGVLWMQCQPKEWRTNIDQTPNTVMDLL